MAEPLLPQFDAILLAGGQSRRMGRDKATIVVGGKPLWRRQLETLRATRPHALFISGPVDGSYPGCDCEMIPDRVSGRGPLAGLSAGLRRTNSPWLLVLAIDLPRMTPAFLVSLVRLAARESRGVVPMEDGRLHPLAAVYPRVCAPLVEEGLLQGRGSLHEFVSLAEERGMVRTLPVATEQADLFENINSPEDLERFEKAGE